jgi:nucleoside-diphosphate-sugar epimerase
MRILITGATGFIGQKLLKRLTDQHHTLAIHVRKQLHEVDSNVLVFSGELNQFQKEIIDFSPEYVFHLAGCSVYPKNANEEVELWSANVLYGNTLLSIIKETPGLVFVNFTTSLAYDGTELKPFSYYALTKANFVQSLHYFTHYDNVRVFNLILYTVYGEGDNTKRVLNYILDSLDAIEPISMSPGEQIMDFIHVDDVIGLCLQLLENKPNKKIEEIHVGTGRGITLKEAAKLIELLSKYKTNIEFGAIPYRREEKMVNVALIENNRFWKSTIPFEKGIELILLYSNK